MNFSKIVQEKYEKVATSLAQMEKRAVMAESMLEATLQYETGQNKASSSPRFVNYSLDTNVIAFPARIMIENFRIPFQKVPCHIT